MNNAGLRCALCVEYNSPCERRFATQDQTKWHEDTKERKRRRLHFSNDNHLIKYASDGNRVEFTRVWNGNNDHQTETLKRALRAAAIANKSEMVEFLLDIGDKS